MKTDAQYKANQRARDNLILAKIGYKSLEGIMKDIRGLDEHGLKQLQAVLCRRNEPDVKAKDKARPKESTARTGKGKNYRVGTSSHKAQDRGKS